VKVEAKVVITYGEQPPGFVVQEMSVV